MNKIEMEPIGDRVVVLQDAAAEKTEGGILLAAEAQEKPMLGEVVALGRGRWMDNGCRSQFDVVVGQRVGFSKYAGTPVEYDGKEYLIMREDDMLFIDRKSSIRLV